ncbi:MAG TPA: 5'-nucleotidase C-terminal domain-containing protein, partial [Oligoflexia bacterium]|nr:5'-nucleotidase C-terminal domain-containing protein [Oligoflexia bacterium]
SAKEGVDTLVLDAGDFSEGSQFYLADRGEQTWKVMDAMGYDAVTIGNHDWLMGQRELNRLIGNVKPSFNLLGANFVAEEKYQNIRNHLRPFVEFERNGLRVAVIGLSTDLFVWAWRAGKNALLRPETVAKNLLPKLTANNDLVIALTHIGTSGDRWLVRSTKGIDIVIGGHSHTTLSKPVYVRDQRGHSVPIVQTGAHGHLIGSLLVDVVPGRSVKVVKYELIPVDPVDSGKDSHIEGLVHDARRELENDYGRDWLYEVLAHSEVPLERPMNGPTVWGKIVDSAIRERAKAHLSINQGALYGINLPSGPITRETLFEFYPRMFEFSRKYGWTIWTAKAQGWLLEAALKLALENGSYLNTSGLTYDEKIVDGKRRISNMKIGGKPIERFKNYKLALPEGIARGSKSLNKYLRYILQKPTDTKVPIWTAVADKVRRMGTIR